MDAIYWAAALAVLFPYVIYPALVGAASLAFGRPVRRSEPGRWPLPGVSIVIVVHNEAECIARRIREFASRITANGLDGEILIVSDGSTDTTVEVSRATAKEFAVSRVPVRVIDRPEKRGKAAALSAGARAASREILAFADARQTWAPDALVRLLENFEQPDVGAVSGELVIESAPGVLAGVGLYWRFEKWLRRREASLHSTVGLTGAICAVRRPLFQPIPAGTVLDDVYWPLLVAMQGYRVVFDGRALAYDRLPAKVGAEFRRKVRTLAGNFQLIARLPQSLLPWCNPVWFFLIAHKLARLTAPWAMLAMLVTAAALGGPLYSALFAVEALGLLIAAAGLLPAVAARSKLAAAGASFLVLNAAAWCAFWVWATGRSTRSWTKVDYRGLTQVEPAAEPSLAAVGMDDGPLERPMPGLLAATGGVDS